jgi:hypothetical protein
MPAKYFCVVEGCENRVTYDHLACTSCTKADTEQKVDDCGNKFYREKWTENEDGQLTYLEDGPWIYIPSKSKGALPTQQRIHSSLKNDPVKLASALFNAERWAAGRMKIDDARRADWVDMKKNPDRQDEYMDQLKRSQILGTAKRDSASNIKERGEHDH